MKTQEQQKAMLLDKYVENLRLNSDHLFTEDLNLIKEYDAITAQKPLTADPYADEVFSGRLFKKILWYFKQPLNDMPKLSECPSVNWYNQHIGFGRKSREEYIEVMTTYEMWDKI
jgi:hypothetical protein